MNNPIIIEEPKFYSQKGIGIATMFGAPLAASILIRKNYNSLNEEKKGNIALGLGITSTILLFLVLINLPESIVNKIPNPVIPLIYTGIIHLIVNKLQGNDLKSYEEEGNKFISNWNALGIGLLCALTIFIPLVAYNYLEINNPVYETYNIELEKFSRNEEASFKFYDHLETNSQYQLVQELNNITIPYWVRNKKIIMKLDTLEGVTEEMLNQNKILKDYCDLRIKEFRTFKKAIEEDTDKYSDEIDKILLQIEKKLAELN